MTVEHRLVFGLTDILAVIFACKKCDARLSVAPDKLDDADRLIRLAQCPACKANWISDSVSMSRTPTAAFTRFVMSLSQAIVAEKHDDRNVRILLEFAETKP